MPPQWWHPGMEPPAWMPPPPHIRGYPVYGELPENYKDFVRHHPPGTPFPPELPPLLPISDEPSWGEEEDTDPAANATHKKTTAKAATKTIKNTSTKGKKAVKTIGKSNRPTLYYDESSAQVRAILMAIHALNVDVALKPIDISKGEQMQPWYLQARTDFLCIML